jgi:hypothetical protein
VPYRLGGILSAAKVQGAVAHVGYVSYQPIEVVIPSHALSLRNMILLMAERGGRQSHELSPQWLSFCRQDTGGGPLSRLRLVSTYKRRHP